MNAATQPPPATPREAALAASLRRCAYLLNSARLVIPDDLARSMAGDAVDEAVALLHKVPA